MSELDTLSLTELKEQADVMGIAYKHNIGADALRAKLHAALNGDVAAEPEFEGEAEPIHTKERMVTVLIAEDEKDQQPAFLSHNGAQIRIRRGEPVQIKERYLEVLRHANQKVYSKNKNGEPVEKIVPTYPWSLV